MQRRPEKQRSFCVKLGWDGELKQPRTVGEPVFAAPRQHQSRDEQCRRERSDHDREREQMHGGVLERGERVREFARGVTEEAHRRRGVLAGHGWVPAGRVAPR